MTKPKPTQLAKFKQAARELETDDDEKRFNERLGKIAKAKGSTLRGASRDSKTPSGSKKTRE
jgi:hypothetical protein